jgi:DNA-binding NtrC family response regulator
MGSAVVEFRTLGDTVDIPLSSHHRFVDVVGCSVAMRELFATLEKVAPSDLTVLIEGETGSGKERIASAIHRSSRRTQRPYVVLDCGAIPKDLMESVVFGHEKGAFTGAVATRKGVFEQAHGGTIFLDEVGELDLTLQPKLLRLLETREVRKVGSERTIRVDVRVVAATNRDLRAMVGEGTFREDLFFRLSVIQVSAPSLRNRVEDIPLLAQEMLSSLDETSRFSETLSLTQDAMQALMEHAWPGNVRELKNVLERASSLADKPLLQAHDMFLTRSHVGPQDAIKQRGFEGVSTSLIYKEAKKEVLSLFERRYLDELMKRTSGNISQAARESGLTRYHLREMLKRHDLVEKYRSVR